MGLAARAVLLLGIVMALPNSGVAQPSVNLNGSYRCFQGCSPDLQGRVAVITQNEWDLNIVTESGTAYRSWFDWFSPNSRIWIEGMHQGAVYSPNGMTIQFDRGAIWERIDDPQHAAIASCARRYRSFDP